MPSPPLSLTSPQDIHLTATLASPTNFGFLGSKPWCFGSPSRKAPSPGSRTKEGQTAPGQPRPFCGQTPHSILRSHLCALQGTSQRMSNRNARGGFHPLSPSRGTQSQRAPVLSSRNTLLPLYPRPPSASASPGLTQRSAHPGKLPALPMERLRLLGDRAEKGSGMLSPPDGKGFPGL